MSKRQYQQDISRRELLGGMALAGSILPNLAYGAAAPKEAPAAHNWMLVGSETAFLSHLSMFEKLNPAGTDYLTPHRFQVILQAAFAVGSHDASPLYFADRAKNPDVKMFTVQPAKLFVLPQITTPPLLTSFQGTVFRGHLERGGEPVSGLEKVAVNIQRVVHFHKFDPKAASPKSLEYLLFGNGTELFLAHSIIKPPDFDQIVSVKVSGLTLSPSDLRTTMRLSIPLKENSSTDRLREGEQAAAEMADGRKLTVQALREFYFEEGELMMPATFDDTAEERKSGFSS
jgi:hypothetical protein